MLNKHYWRAFFNQSTCIKKKKEVQMYQYLAIFVINYSEEKLTDAQNELYKWIKNYMKEFQHSPSIRQMMQAMG